MLSFFKKMFNGKTTDNLEDVKQQLQEDTVVSESDMEELGLIEGESGQESGEKEDIYTALSLHESWEEELDNEKRYILSFMQSSLSPLAEGQVAITGFNMNVTQEGLVAFGFVRNGLSRPIRFEEIPLLFLSENGEVIARQTFDLQEMGEIPPHCDRPWSFLFRDENVVGKEVALDRWKLAFEIKRQPEAVSLRIDIEPTMAEQMTAEQIEHLEQALQTLPPVAAGEFNIGGVQATRMEEGEVRVLVFLRNGTPNTLTVSQLPLILLDAAEEEVASGVFRTGELDIEPGTAKLWQFIFPKELVSKDNPDLSQWMIRMPEHVTE